MLNRILAFVAGIISSTLIILLIETIGVVLFPISQPEHLEDIVKSDSYIEKSGTWPLLIVLFAYIIGSFIGGLVIKLILKENNKFIAIRLGLVLTFLGIFNLYTYSHPMWFIILSTLCYVPFSYLGYQSINRLININPNNV